MKLTSDDKKYYSPNAEFIERLTAQLSGKRVLEIGPGDRPFPGATEFVEWQDKPDLNGPVHAIDITTQPLPFEDKSFDFIYCRHVLEDLHNPFPLIEEMSRIGKAGYIETPSIIAEMGRGVDVGSDFYRGFHHHFYFVWMRGSEMTFLNKYPIVEWLKFDDEFIIEKLRAGPLFWNMCHMWKNGISYKHLRNPVDYFLPTEYVGVINEAMESV